MTKQICCKTKCSGDLNTKLFKWWERGWMPNGPVFKCHLNTKHMGLMFSFLCTGPIFEW